MPLGKFTAYTVAGCIPWVLLLAIIGREVGDRWEEWRDYLHYFDYAVVAAIVIAVVYWLVRRRRGSAKWETTPPA
jgi:membrane protein DedA with SNARE-associated domain